MHFRSVKKIPCKLLTAHSIPDFGRLSELLGIIGRLVCSRFWYMTDRCIDYQFTTIHILLNYLN